MKRSIHQNLKPIQVILVLLTLSLGDVFGDNDPPSISNVNVTAIDEDGSGTLTFDVDDTGDDPTDLDSLIVTVSSNDTGLIANPLSANGTGTMRSVSLVPIADQNGSTTITITVEDDIGQQTSQQPTVTVTAQPDAPVINGSLITSIDDNQSLAVFSGLTVSDADHNTPNAEFITVTITFPTESPGHFLNSSNAILQSPITLTSSPNNIGALLDQIKYRPLENVDPVGNDAATQTLTFEVTDSTNRTDSLPSPAISIDSINDAPSISVFVSPSSISDTSGPVMPFTATVTDPDVNEEFNVTITAPATTVGTLSASSLTGLADFQIESAIQGLSFTPREQPITSTNAEFEFIISNINFPNEKDSTTVSLELQGINDPPLIVGITQSDQTTTDDQPIALFSDVTITDPENDQLDVFVTPSPSAAGSFTDASGNTVAPTAPGNPLMTGAPGVVTNALNTLRFIPTQDRVPVGETEAVSFTIRIEDGTSTRTNTRTRVIVRSVNGRPGLTYNSLVQFPSDPVSVAPAPPVNPFTPIGITDDGAATEELTVSIILDDPEKGTLSGGGFVESQAGSGVYERSDTPAAVTTAIHSVEFIVNPDFVFLPSMPGGTTFTIRVVDGLPNTTTKVFSIILANEGRNLLVTSNEDFPVNHSNAPGTLRHAIAHADNNDCITIALRSYPDLILLEEGSGMGTLQLNKNITIKGPGADLLTISADSEGDGVGNFQIFQVNAFVSMEGIKLTKGLGSAGGAVSVGTNGSLTMRFCAVTDSRGLNYGGGIDVNGGALFLHECFIGNNRTDDSFGQSGAGVSIFTDKPCGIFNTTFSGNLQRSVTGSGGGALYVENAAPATELLVDVLHCTFSENADEADKGSSIRSNVFGSRVRVGNCIFADGQDRNLEVAGAGQILSLGGNISDDQTRTILTQGGIGNEHFLLNQNTDLTETDPLLLALAQTVGPTPTYGLQTGSPAIGHSVNSNQGIDQRGALRDSDPDSGAVESGLSNRIVINEFQTQDVPDDFIEFYMRRDSGVIDLSNFVVCVNGQIRHQFDPGTTVAPGFGIIVADSAVTATSNTPVVISSLDPLSLTERGLIELKDTNLRVVARAEYIDLFADPDDPSVDLSFTGNSLTLAPQFMGAAYLPSSTVLSPPAGGADLDTPPSLPTSPGSDTGGTPFGSPNAFPLAVGDVITVHEDQLFEATVLSNDLDADGDELVIVDVSSTSGEGGDDDSITTAAGAVVEVMGRSLFYDPIGSVLQSLPEGAEATDVFYYEILDLDPSGGFRSPTARSEAAVHVQVLGANDPPEPMADTVQTDEETILRIMGDPDLVGSPTTFDTDDIYPLPRSISNSHLLDGDEDVDSDDSEATLRIVGVVDSVTDIVDFAETSEGGLVEVSSPAHGLLEGQTILISGYGGHPSYNRFHAVALIDDDTFSIPTAFIDNDSVKGVWTILDDDNRLEAVSEKGAEVVLEIRTDRIETNVVYNPRASAYLNGLPNLEVGIDSFYYAVEDSHKAVALGKVTIEVTGVNDAPEPGDDPPSLEEIDVPEGDTLADVIPTLDVLYALPPASGHPNQANVPVVQEGETILISDLWVTSEDTLLPIPSADLLQNDTDVDRTDTLTVISSDSSSALGASVEVNGANVDYDPRDSVAILNKLAREELVIDTFEITVSDSRGGDVNALVAVLVVGANDKPIAEDDFTGTDEDTAFTINVVEFPPADPTMHDRDDDVNGVPPDNELLLLPLANPTTGAGAAVSIEGSLLSYDPTVSATLNALGEGESFTDTVDYTVTDGSFLFANDDLFKVAADGAGYALNVLANDRNLTGGGDFTIIEVGPASNGGEVTIDGAKTGLLYTPEVNFVGDEHFTYTVEDDQGHRDKALVTVRPLVNQLNGNLQANDDHFTLARGQAPLLNVLANDNTIPASGADLVITQILSQPADDSVELEGNALRFDQSSSGPFPYTATFSYEISGGGTAKAAATVTVLVVDRANTLHLREDFFSVLVDSAANELDVLDNDHILPGTPEALSVSTITVPPAKGTAEISADGDTVRYTPEAGFVGTETFEYEAADGFGGTGTQQVTVMVGALTTNSDIFGVPFDDSTKSDDDGVTELDVLNNDGVLQAANGNAFLVGVTPDVPAFGTVTVSTDGSVLLFDPAEGATGEQTYTYTIEDGAGDTTTGSLTVVIVRDAVSANPDAFTVEVGTSANFIDVLGNDVSAPDRGRPLTVVSVGTGLDGPNHGGTAVKSDDGSGLIYTPAPGFEGEETFTYTMTDSRNTDTAKVVVDVASGVLKANPDHYTVFFQPPTENAEGDPLFTEFSLPVLANDRVLPDFGQTLNVVGVGIDDTNADNAPDQQGSAKIGSGGSSMIYSPRDEDGPFPYTERFTYELSDGTARRADTTVIIHVLERSGERDIDTNDDAFTVESGSASNILQVLPNDNVKPAPASGWTITGVSAPTPLPADPDGAGDLIVINGPLLLFTPEPGFVGTKTFTYDVSDGVGGSGMGTVKVKVGDLPLCDDTFIAVSDSTDNVFDVLANDNILPDDGSDFNLTDAGGTDQGGTVTVNAGTVLYTPDPNYTGPYPYIETFQYTIEDDSNLVVHGHVAVTVYEENSDRDTATVFIEVDGVNDAPQIDVSDASMKLIGDKGQGTPFDGVVIIEVDENGGQTIKVTVTINNPASGVFTSTLANLGGFVEQPPGSGIYVFQGTAAEATTALEALTFVPVENWVPVTVNQDPENFGFTITVMDDDPDVSNPLTVTDDSISIDVFGENDPPVIVGTVSDQKVYYRGAIKPFVAVTLTEIDDHDLQPLTVDVVLDDPSHGVIFSPSGAFAAQGNGVFRFLGTAAEASRALMHARFVPSADQRIGPEESEVTQLTLHVDDSFASPVIFDDKTTVEAIHGHVKKVGASDGLDRDDFGFSVAISGEFMVVGAREAHVPKSKSGSAYIYRRDLGGTRNWGELKKLTPSDGDKDDRFGTSVAISGDVIVVGSVRDSDQGNNSGSAYIFKRHHGGTDNWGQFKKLLPSDGRKDDEFGISVAVDGDTIIVGADKDGDHGEHSGSAYIFSRDEGGPDNWGEVTKIVPDDSDKEDHFGASVSLSGDLALVGAARDDDQGNDSGSAYIFSRNEGGSDNWGQIEKLLPIGGSKQDAFGFSVSIDGSTAVVGAPKTDEDEEKSGVAYVFSRDEGGPNNWGQVKKLDPLAPHKDDEYGFSVAVSNQSIVIGMPFARRSRPNDTEKKREGRAFTYQRDHDPANPLIPLPNNWGLVEAFEPNSTADFKDEFGFSVAIDAGTIAVGAREDELPGRNEKAGAAYVLGIKFNNAPLLKLLDMPIPDQTAEVGQLFELAPFGDPDTVESLPLSGTPLPGWLSYDSGTGLLSGTPAAVDLGAVLLSLTVVDETGAVAVKPDGTGGTTSGPEMADFVIIVVNASNPVLGDLPVTLAAELADIRVHSARSTSNGTRTGEVILNYFRPNASDGAALPEYEIEVSEDLVEWLPLNGMELESRTARGDAGEDLSWRIRPEGRYHFYRLRIRE